MNGLDLFAGSGIGSLAFKHIIPNYRSVGYVEWNEYCCQVIEQRIKDGILCDAPIFHLDIREFNRTIAPIYTGLVDIIAAGFPCQPFSHAGKRKGETDERNMWPATIECISIIRPRYAFLENVPGLFTHEYIRRIFGDLAEIGYDCEWLPLSAIEIGAGHIREREWVLAYADIGRHSNTTKFGTSTEKTQFRSCRTKPNVADTECKRLHQRHESEARQTTRCSRKQCEWWEIEPDVGRVAHGVADRVERLKMLGNGIVPQVVKRILQIE